ncbi:MAG: catalase [Geminicoccaceae bacterium]|nr:catalase [Geminicoccaceae bacterium]
MPERGRFAAFAFSYSDAHRYRIGANYHQVPVNHAKNAPVAAPDGRVKEPPFPVTGPGDRWDEFACDGEDYYGQPRLFWSKALDEGGRARLCENIAKSMGDSPEWLQQALLAHRARISPEFVQGVAKGLGIAPKALQAAE